MNIVLLSPYHGGSHLAWAEGYREASKHRVDVLKLPARFWKWRMHGGGVTLARRFLKADLSPDIFLATDMLDLTTFLALTRETTASIPAILYMHENQLTYPLPADKSTGPMRRQLGERDHHYAFINYASMLAAHQVWFNSHYHKRTFFEALPRFLGHFPEFTEKGTVKVLQDKSLVLPVGIDLTRLDRERDEEGDGRPPLILWNQRWEYDKNPGLFFAALDRLDAEGLPFQVALCGQQYGKQPPIFGDWINRNADRVLHSGFADDETYRRLLWAADVVVSTADHEYFGISIQEAIYAETFPILPARLSYPEVLPDEYHDLCLYPDFEGLISRLEFAVCRAELRRKTAVELSTLAARLDWSQVAPHYDRQLESVAALNV